MKHRRLFGTILVLLVLQLAACGATRGGSTTSGPQQVQVRETDYKIASSVTTFTTGTAYHFVITNAGRTAHEFMIMPSDMGSMSGMSMGEMDKMALAKVENITPGQTRTLDYTFPANSAGSHPQFACYYPGHYEAGMKLDVTVTAQQGAMAVFDTFGQILLTAAGMTWHIIWSLVLGFLISGIIQAYFSRAGMSQVLGRARLKDIALATGFGAASSSCSYAATAAARSMFKRGAHLIPALAFMFASTNLVIELGLILWQMMGWQFALAEWLGGVLLVAMVTVLVKLTYPRKLVEEGRTFHETGTVAVMDHGDELAPGRTLWEKLRSGQGWVYVAHYVAMDWSMVWKDLLIGFLAAGVLGVLVPNTFWNALFVQSAPTPVQVVENAIVGPLIAVFSFVCSIGNVPLAAVLFAGGITFGGAIAFIYADLIVLPILNIYRKYYGWRLAAYITSVLFATMVLTAILIDAVFAVLDRLFPAVHFIPTANAHLLHHVATFSFDYTAVLNLLSFVVIAILIYLNVKHPMMMHMNHAAHSGHDMAAMGEA